jgi:hypothetical protein
VRYLDREDGVLEEEQSLSKSVLDDATAHVDKVRQDARNRYERHLTEAKSLETQASEHRQAAQAWQSVFEPGSVDPIDPGIVGNTVRGKRDF